MSGGSAPIGRGLVVTFTSGGTGGHGGPTLDRQVMYRALDAAADACLIWGWRGRDNISITILTAPGAAALPFVLRDSEVPAFLAERVRIERVAPERWSSSWARLLDCMERLAESVRWWEVP